MRAADFFDPDFRSTDTPFFIGGCGRSGTTLLRVILDSHRRLYCGPESWLWMVPQLDVGWFAARFHLPLQQVAKWSETATSRQDFIETFLAGCASHSHKPRWGDKTPKNVHHFEQILSSFPNAKLIHILRDPRDVVCSLRTHPRHKLVDGRLVATGILQPIENCLERWISDVTAGLRFRDDPRVHEIRYEELVKDPRNTIDRVLSFLSEDWDDACLEHYKIRGPSRDILQFPQNPEVQNAIHQSAVGRWQRELEGPEIDFIEAAVGDLLRLLGYHRAGR